MPMNSCNTNTFCFVLHLVLRSDWHVSFSMISWNGAMGKVCGKNKKGPVLQILETHRILIWYIGSFMWSLLWNLWLLDVPGCNTDSYYPICGWFVVVGHKSFVLFIPNKYEALECPPESSSLIFSPNKLTQYNIPAPSLFVFTFQ